MPTYQYACTECGERLEVVQRFSDDPLTECPRCHGRLRKLFSPVGVVFKGSGFYKTDSRTTSTSSKAPASSGTEASKPTTSGDSGGSSGSSEPASGSTSTSSSTSSSTSDGSKVA
jgi:putative FmdB family regulatory protein